MSKEERYIPRRIPDQVVVITGARPALAVHGVQLTDQPEPPFGRDNFNEPMEVADPLYGALRERWPWFAAAAWRRVGTAAVVSALFSFVIGKTFVSHPRR